METIESLGDWIRRTGSFLELAETKGWSELIPRLKEEQQQNLLNLRKGVSEIIESFASPQPVLPRLGDLLDELRHLEEEFDEVSIDWREKFLAVKISTVILEGVDLGAFSIQLCWTRLAQGCDGSCFDVVALDPNTPSCNEEVTHPHVKNDELCVGDALLPLRHSLQQGRLVDAFLLIRSVLTTYNPNSAYVQLDKWDGSPCQDCGDDTCEDDLCICERCRDDYCCNCVSCCCSCDQLYCSNCESRCAVCEVSCCSCCLQTSADSDRDCCPDCRRPCSVCGRKVASDELDENGCCPSCLETEADSPLLVNDPNPQPENSHESIAIP